MVTMKSEVMKTGIREVMLRNIQGCYSRWWTTQRNPDGKVKVILDCRSEYPTCSSYSLCLEYASLTRKQLERI